MAGGKNDNFRKNPAGFLAQNLVVVNIQQLVRAAAVNPNGLPVVGPKFNAGAVITVDIRKTDRFYAQNSNGDAIDACELVEATGDASRVFGRSYRFQVYYLPFFNNATMTMDLAVPLGQSSPLYYVTDTMNGCAFAASNGLTPTVGHFNYTVGGVDGAPIDDAEINRQINVTYPFGTYKSLRKAGYKRTAADAITLFGVRGRTQWSYSWQRYRQVAWRNQKRVYEIDANVHTI